jgi:hypothetical protein
MTPVGAKCRKCARARLQPIFRVSPLHVLAALVTSLVGGLAIGLIGSFLIHVVPLVGFLVRILFPFVSGLLLGDAVSRVSRYRHHVLLKISAALGVVVSYFALALGDFILISPVDFLRSGLLGPFLGRALLNFVVNPIEILFLALGIWVAVQRVG